MKPEDELFQLVVGGYGLFGVIVEVELNLADNEDLFDKSEEVPIAQYPQYFTDKIEGNEHIPMHLCRLSLEKGQLLKKAFAQNYYRATTGEPTEHLVNEPPRGTITDRIFMGLARNSNLARSLWWKREEQNLKVIKQATRNETMRPPINAIFVNKSSARREWLQEYFVPRDKLVEYLEFLGPLLDKNDVCLMNASVRFVKKDGRSRLGYAREQDRFAIVLFFSQSLNKKEIKKTEKWVQTCCDKLGEVGGAFYLPYMHFATQEQFQSCYPQYEEIRELKKTYDPTGLFDNGLYQDYLLPKEVN